MQSPLLEMTGELSFVTLIDLIQQPDVDVMAAVVWPGGRMDETG